MGSVVALGSIPFMWSLHVLLVFMEISFHAPNIVEMGTLTWPPGRNIVFQRLQTFMFKNIALQQKNFSFDKIT